MDLEFSLSFMGSCFLYCIPINFQYHCHVNVEIGLQLVESREHVSARVLSTTTEQEDQTEKDNPIKQVTDKIKPGNQGGSTLEKGDAIGENVNGDDAIDVDDNDVKLTKSTDASTLEPQLKVSDAFSLDLCLCLCFSVWFIKKICAH